MSSNSTQSESYRQELQVKIQEKLNKIITDEYFFMKWDYYFEPRPTLKEDSHNKSRIFTFINPFSKKRLKILWNKIKGTKIIDPVLDEKSLEEFHNALEYIEWKVQESQETAQKKQYVDFFEDENMLIIVVEIPNTPENIIDDIELMGSPHELIIQAGPFEKSIHLNPRVDPQSAEAVYEDHLLEIRMRKTPKPPKTKIKVQERKMKTEPLKDMKYSTNTKITIQNKTVKQKKDTTKPAKSKKQSKKSTEIISHSE